MKYSHFHIRPLVLLVLMVQGLWARPLSLIEEGDLDFCILEEEEPTTLTEEFDSILNNRLWLNFEEKLWKSVIESIETDTFEEMREAVATARDSTAPVLTPEMYPEARTELPYQAQMSITGRKSISMKYGFYRYFGDEDERTVIGAPSGVPSGFEMDQELRVRIQGQVGDKITVNVDYDDTKPAYDEDARKISVVYKGDPGEIIQEAAFGDINLHLPSTRFVGYSRNVFGASVRGQYENLKFMAIGSQTKGTTDVQEFYGQTSFQKIDIRDTSYIRRRYYKGAFEAAHIPFEPGSLRVYIDDRDPTTIVEKNKTEMTVGFYGSTRTHSGDFYQLVAGRDYYVDNQTGVINFRQNIGSNYLIAIEYRYSGGEVGYSSSLPQVIKSVNESFTTEKKNRYNLGSTRIMRDDFVIRFLDLNRNTVSLPEGSYRIDYDLGLLEFTDPTPFYNESKPEGYAAGGFKDIYRNVNPQNRYIIYIEYKRMLRNYFLRPNIIRGSERVLMNGTALTRDVDYVIDYMSGFLTFLNEERIDETTRIEVTYEYAPFGGGMKETLVGLRGEYAFSRNFNLGGTVLYNWSSAPMELPQLGSTPQSTLVLDTDFNLNIPRSRFFPFPTKISGELAYSHQNPNTVGSASVDNMEGIRQSYGVSTNPDSWQIAATPSLSAGDTAHPAHPEWLFNNLDEDDIYLSDVNPRLPSREDERRRVLHMNYSLPKNHPLDPTVIPEASIVQVISRTGTDFSDRDTIALWVKGDGQGADLRIDFGSISEDADGTGILKTEDLNSNGMLDLGEDIGWEYEFGSEVIRIGARNSRIDTNDLNRDGFLDTAEDIHSFDSLDQADLNINWTGWRLINIPIDTSIGDWTAIKHVRLTLRGSNKSGRIEIMSIEAVGNRWELAGDTDKLDITAVNNFESDYVPLIGNSDFERLYRRVGGTRSERDQALEFKYKNLEAGTTAYAFTRFPTGMDFTTHKTLNFFLYGVEGDPVDFGIWIGAGSGDSENYYFARVKASDISPLWRMYSFSFPDDFEVVSGDPSPANIMEIRVAPLNTAASSASGKIWLNEIHMGEPDSKEGRAMRGDVSSSIPGFLDFGGSYEKMERDFQTIVTPSRNQDTENITARARLTLLSFMPVTGSFTRSTVITPPDRIVPAQRNPYLREEDAGEVITDTLNLGANFTMRLLPSLSAAYTRSISESNLTGKRDITENYRGDLTYSVPLNLPLMPKNIRASVRKTDTIVEWEDYKRFDNPDGGAENRLEETLAYSGSGDLSFFNLLNFRPSFSRNEKHRTWEYYSGPLDGEKSREPWSISQDIGVSAQLNLVDWLRPSGQASARIMENYNFISTNSVSIPGNTKDISRNFSASFNVGVPVRNIIRAFKPADTLNINTSYTAEKGDAWQGIPADYTVFDKLNPNYTLSPSTDTEATPDTLTSRNSIRHTINWSPFRHMGLNEGILNLVGGVAMRANYNFIESRRDVKGNVLDTITKLWPEVELNHGAVERLPYTGDHIKNIRLRTNFSYREESNYSNDEHIDLGIQRRYGANCRFLLLKDYDSLIEFSRSVNTKDNLRDDSSTFEESLTVSGQVRLTLWDNWNFILRYSQSRTEKTSTLSETPLTDLRQYRPGISFDARIDLPDIINLPFINREVALASRMRLTGGLDAEFSRSELNVDRTNFDRYSLSGKTEMDVASNMRLTIGLGGQYMINKIIRENSYLSFFASTDMVIIF